MRTADLTGGPLDAWTARAVGVPAAELELRANGTLCVRNMPVVGMTLPMVLVLDYSTNWALTGPLITKYRIVEMEKDHFDVWSVLSTYGPGQLCIEAEGPDELTAICRAVVRAAFGDEVEDLP